ncbi:MAG: hypothetical protein QM582_10835 [Micropruina sp.]|uniref:hypothetical protein n=1 Tax=Micropruina sp. TaxID=2737536 RepID=UPI0039E4EADC
MVHAVSRLVLIALVALMGLVGVPAPPACACSCKGFTTDEAVREASAVFAGEVIATTHHTTGDIMESVHYTIRVGRVYKGTVPTQVVVTTAPGEPSCGLRLSGRVTVFASGTGDTLQTSLCNAPLKLEVAKLGPGVAPTTPSPEASPSPTPTPSQSPAAEPGAAPDWLVPGLIGVVVVLAAIGGGWLVRRARR